MTQTAVPLRQNDIKELSDLAFVLKRAHNFAGSVEENPKTVHLYKGEQIEFLEIPYIPALVKINSEIIDNSVDEAIRTKFEYANKINVTYENGITTVRDNGRGLPIEQNEKKKWVPEAIFTQLRTGSNFDDEAGREGKGMNGIGSALTAMLCRKFSVDTANGVKRYQQRFENHLQKIHKPMISDSTKNYTEVSFEPNYDWFNISDEAKSYLPRIIEKMVIEQAFCYPEITFSFNGRKINTKSLKQFLGGIHETFEFSETEKCRIGVFYSDTEFRHISFVNGLSTFRGGTHVDYVTDKIVGEIRAYIAKKHKLDVKPIDIKSKLFIFLSMRMINPKFDGQTKETLENKVSDFSDTLTEALAEKFLKSICKNEEIVLPIVESYRIAQQAKENIAMKKELEPKKALRIEKYFPASEKQKYLVVTEGDSANGLIMSVLGRKEFSFFPVQGKPLNTLEASFTKIRENEETMNVIKILNLNLSKDDHDLTHDFVLIATDADKDGDHIKALFLCLFQRFGKSLLTTGRIKYLRTPIIVGKKNNKIVKYFFTVTEYSDYVAKHGGAGVNWRYIKGLGSLKKEDMAALIKAEGLDNFIVDFEVDEEYDALLKSWMSDETSDDRKEFLRGMEMDISKL